ncbi:hypothetical protein BHU72_14240 [Desulfuribacillus stibiiarsenatis]|uniref:Peptidase M28 domain-containing protein n=1 Tax=Desulfuribacillus stibiiarsenatis TaxID=1390249 RepID=A0A1E5L7U1_9FIRM|nr:M28 family peptidase [Desulfuribacillus stibiiarsenatis]OEH86084.1 hypothetical protein BHU72_14240 [Desulfuribacillus stibiiarsenatis]
MNLFEQQLLELLSINGASGQEQEVTKYLTQALKNLVDSHWNDEAGNLLAEKKVGNQQGMTILLSAHMDTAGTFSSNREIIREGDILTSSEGILGADDRAGIAVILDVLRRVESTRFNGTIKVSFTVQEEVGCIGSSMINPHWLEGVNAAIVVDRRGSRDIVINNRSTTFCHRAVGDFYEYVSTSIGMEDWKATTGGLSDTAVYARLGINSVNLSVGYQNEHTNREILNIIHAQQTSDFVLQALHLINHNPNVFALSNRYEIA